MKYKAFVAFLLLSIIIFQVLITTENKPGGEAIPGNRIPANVLVDACDDFLMLNQLMDQASLRSYDSICNELVGRVSIELRVARLSDRRIRPDLSGGMALSAQEFKHFPYVESSGESSSELFFKQLIADLINIINASQDLMAESDSRIIDSHLEGVIARSISGLIKLKPLDSKRLSLIYEEANVQRIIEQAIGESGNIQKKLDVIDRFPDGNEPYGYVPK